MDSSLPTTRLNRPLDRSTDDTRSGNLGAVVNNVKG